MPPWEPRYIRLPRDPEAMAYFRPEYAKGAEDEAQAGNAPKYDAGGMYYVLCVPAKADAVCGVFRMSSATPENADICGYLHADAIDGFPVPLYPRCLQKAHEHAQVVDFDLTILQDEVFTAVRGLVPDGTVIDEFQLNVDASARRYE